MSALTSIVDGAIWNLERPVWFAGVRQRVNTTVLRLADGSLLLHSPAPLTDEQAEELNALGPVRWLVVPNCFHHLGTPAAAARYPDAHVVGPASALGHNKALRLHLDIADASFREQLPELQPLPLAGLPFLDETVLFHAPTQTLLAADLLVRASAHDHFTLRWAARLTGFYEQARVPPDAKKKLEDRAAIAQSLTAILDQPAQRLILGHADVMTGNWRDPLARAFHLEGVAV